MIEIKFRAWDKIDNNMLTWSLITQSAFNMLEGHSYPIMYSVLTNWMDRFEVMQYTGLKDKNGKEIYEGDVVRYRYPRDIEGKDIVEFDEVVEWENTTDFMSFGIHQLMEHEIIGNIYQHPELLNHTP